MTIFDVIVQSWDSLVCKIERTEVIYSKTILKSIKSSVWVLDSECFGLCFE